MNIVSIAIDKLIPYDKNPRINAMAVDKVAQSIKEFGFKNPVIVDKDNVIICGHTRLTAAKKLNMTDVPCIIADDLTEEQIKAFRLADNKVAEFSTWDFDMLMDELTELDIDMGDFGFDMSFLDDAKSVSKEYENTSKEISTDDYKDEHFDHECPRCKFKFND